MVLAPFLSLFCTLSRSFPPAMASEQAVAASVVRSVWLEQPKFEAAERHYYEVQADRHSGLKIEVIKHDNHFNEKLVFPQFSMVRLALVHLLFLFSFRVKL